LIKDENIVLIVNLESGPHILEQKEDPNLPTMHPSTVPPDLPISPKNPHLPRLLLSNLLHHFYPTDEKAVKETWLFVANRHLQLFINSARLLG